MRPTYYGGVAQVDASCEGKSSDGTSAQGQARLAWHVQGDAGLALGSGAHVREVACALEAQLPTECIIVEGFSTNDVVPCVRMRSSVRVDGAFSNGISLVIRIPRYRTIPKRGSLGIPSLGRWERDL